MFREWIPNNLSSSMCSKAPKGIEMSAAFVGNTTAMFRKKSFCTGTQMKAWIKWSLLKLNLT